MRKNCFCLILCFLLFSFGCMPRVNILSGGNKPFEESYIQKGSSEKILVIPITGFISNKPKRFLFESQPGLLAMVKASLNKAANDKNIKGIILKINSPGGSGCISDIIYNEILEFKKKTGIKVVALFMDTAASGAYYIALASDCIIAHPTTITGSIGAVVVNVEAYSFLDKLGISVNVTKSGRNKDTGSPFRPPTDEDNKIVQKIINSLAARFHELVWENRNIISEKDKNLIKTARIFTAQEALDLHLIDKIGYFNDCVKKSKEIFKTGENPSIITYKSSPSFNENIYNNMSFGSKINISSKDLKEMMDIPEKGFYYLWVN